MTSTIYGPAKPFIDAADDMAGLHSFASVTIHGIGTYDNSSRISGTFNRAPSFPAPVHTRYLWDTTIPVDEWSPLPQPTSGHLELQLEEKFGEGTSGTSYASNVKSSTASNMPGRICVKWAKGDHCRTLARDTWFYEQLYRTGNCEGVITPRCYGFFTMKFEDLLKSVAGYENDSDTEPDEEDENDDGRLIFKPWAEVGSNIESLLPDDPCDGSLCERNFCDDEDLKANSRWAWWSQKKGSKRLIAVLLLEELGACYPLGQTDESALSDIKEIAADLGHTGIRHYDLRAANVLRSLDVPGGLTEEVHDPLATDSVDEISKRKTRSGYCERHQKYHAWRLIDFDRATKTIFQDEHPEEKKACLGQGVLIGNEYFMGTLQPWVFPYSY